MIPQGKCSKAIDLVKAAAQGHSRSPEFEGEQRFLARDPVLCQ